MKTSALSYFALVLFAGTLFAQTPVPEDDPEEHPVSPPVRITFAPPELSGRFVLGVFDANGSVVRTLIQDGDESVFAVGLNGFISYWDGNDDAGKRAPAGRYFVRGYVIGAVQIDGLAYWFNDWVADGFSDWRDVRDVVLMGPDQGAALVQSGGQWVVSGFEVDGSVQWQTALDASDSAELQASTDWVVVRQASGWSVFASADGTLKKRSPAAENKGPFAVTKDRLLEVQGDQVIELALPELQSPKRWNVPANLVAIAATADGIAGIERGGTKIWWATPGAVLGSVSLNAGEEAVAIASGAGRSVWVSLRSPAGSAVRELHPSEGVIRELKRKSDEPLPVQVSASGRRLGLFATESHGTRWTCLERAVSEPEPGEGEEKAVDWTIIQDRSTQVCADFGLGKEGPIASAAGQTLPFELSVRLVPNELEPQQNPILKVTARAESGRVWLHAADGLKLLPVSEPGGWNRVALVTGDSDATAKVFQGNGWVVEGFEITGLNQLAAFDAGSFLLAAPTKEEPPAGN